MKHLLKSLYAILFSVVILSCRTQAVPMVEMVEIPGGSMVLGSEEVEDNKPHRVTLDTFYMAKYPVTMKLWKQFIAETKLDVDWNDFSIENDFPFKQLLTNDEYAAQLLNWYCAAAFCNWLSRKEGLKPAYKIQGEIVWSYSREKNAEPEVSWDRSSDGYRLPTEAEWEYAARGGQLSKGYQYAGSDDPNKVGLYRQDKPYPVGQFLPNELGLYDMGSNVETWCWDWADQRFWEFLPEKNPSLDRKEDVHNFHKYNHMKELVRVLRGGDWASTPCSVYVRSDTPPSNFGWIGIRLVRSKIEK